jgi:hypothetical protein
MTAPSNPNAPVAQPTFLPLNDRPPLWRRPGFAWLAMAALLVLHVAALRLEGHRWWCKCGQWNLWSGDTHSFHNSQHLFDAYSFSHVSHGVLLCGLCAWLLPSAGWSWRLVAATAIEVAWEIAENTQFVIDRYRAATISLDYYGDSVANSLGDVLSCVFGFLIARYLGLWRSILLLVVLEAALLFWIRDNLLLNVVMLIHPIDAIKAWQNGH